MKDFDSLSDEDYQSIIHHNRVDTRKSQVYNVLHTLSRLIHPKAKILFLLLFLPFQMTTADPILTDPGEFTVIDYVNGKVHIKLRSVEDNTNKDSWHDYAGEPHTLTYEGKALAELGYYYDGTDGEIDPTECIFMSGVSMDYGGDVESEFITLKIDKKYFSAGQNTLKFNGVWLERQEGDDASHDVEESLNFTFPKPDAASNLQATTNQYGQVQLTWSKPSTPVSRVKVLKNGSEQTTLNADQTSWEDTELANNSSDSYGIMYEYDWYSGIIASETASIQPPDPPKPDVPAGVQATTDRCDGNIKISWRYNDSEVDDVQFKVLRNGVFNTVSGDKRSYTDYVGEHESYNYTVKTIGPLGSSAESSEATGSTSGDPSTPGNFNASISGNNVILSWDQASNANKYVIKRTSSDGNLDYEISDPTTTSKTDKKVKGCVTYTYQLFAANACTQEAGITGIEANTSPSVRINPDLNDYIRNFDASKAYFPDKIMLEWEVEGDNLSFVDEFVIKRRKAGEGTYESLATVSEQATYEDKNAIGGVLYEYKIQAKSQCENDILTSNSLETLGFRTPYGVINGKVSYENGVNVKGVEVLAEKSAEAIGTSLVFDGSASVQVPDASELKPSEFITTEAWVRSETTTGTADIINKTDGSYGYRLYREGTDVIFRLNVNGTWQEVTASNALKAGDYTHVAGVYDSTGVKIYINGDIPSITSYMLENDDIDYLAATGVSQEVLDAMSNDMQGISYSDFNNFKSDLIASVDSAQANRILPLITARVTIKDTLDESYTELPGGSIQHANVDLEIGTGFSGNIDEIRLWNQSRSGEQIKFDYKRVMGNAANGLAAYWRCDENFGDHIYDASKSNGEFHKNDGSFSGNVTWSNTIPPKDMLGWMGKTDENGNYTIPYVPYLGSGENFTLTPRYKQHQFDPNSRNIFLGENNATANGQNFTDISSFKVSGTVTYENTYCGVEGAMLAVDGEAVLKNGNPVYTDQNGEFEIAVPVGHHSISVSKNQHVFRSSKFPPDPQPTYNFQESLTGIDFIDTTTVTVTGRVVGGTVEGNKKPGLGRSKNNIGVAEFNFKAATGCTSYHIKTDSATGEYSLDIPPMNYLIEEFGVAKNPKVADYFNNEFPEADFSTVKPEKTATHTYSGMLDATIEIDTVARTATMDIDGEESLVTIDEVELLNNGNNASFSYQGNSHQYSVDKDTVVTVIPDAEVEVKDAYTDTAAYNYRYDLIYRTKPEIRVTAMDSVSPFTGEDAVNYTDPYTKAEQEFNVAEHPFYYPVFVQGNEYKLIVHAEEVYYNQDMCEGVNGCSEAVADYVPVEDGKVHINNQLALNTSPDPLSLNKGSTLYSFTGGHPTMATNAAHPWRDYSSAMSITVKINDVGYSWEAIEQKDELNFDYTEVTGNENLHPDDKLFRGYVLGDKPVQGTDFITNGPKVVQMILRDPPGSESYSYLEEGTSFSVKKSLSTTSELTESLGLSLYMGSEHTIGLANEVEMDIDNDLSINMTMSQTWHSDKSLTKEYTVTETYKTSDSPEKTGAASDLFMGKSENHLVSLSDKLTILPTSYADSTGIPTTGKEADAHKIGLQSSIVAAPAANSTHFVYTGDHIENTLIPNLIALRNSLFQKIDNGYESNLPMSHPQYGSNNDDPDWGDQATTDDPINTNPDKDYDGPSYTYIPQDSTEDDNGERVPEYHDKVRKYNQQIRLWREALERNEMEKYHAKQKKNISFDAGPTYEYSTETSITQSHTQSFESTFNPEITKVDGIRVAGKGLQVTRGLSFSLTQGKTTTREQTTTNTFGYVLHDPDQGDYLSVDIKDPNTGTGPVFSVKGGRTMCPHETAYDFKYYEPTMHAITQEVIDELSAMFEKDDSDQEVVDWFMEILTHEKSTQRMEFDADAKVDGPYLVDQFSISDNVKELIHDDAMINVPQIKDRHFETKLSFAKAIEEIINLHLDMSDQEATNDDVIGGTTDNLEDMQKSDIQEMSGQIETDENGVLSKIYVFSGERRKNLNQIWARYREHINAITETKRKEFKQIGETTVRRERPKINITGDKQQFNVPDDNLAYFTLTMKNEAKSAQFYKARVLESTNPDGAVIKIDGEKVNRSFEIEAQGKINKTMSVGMGKPDVYKYDSLQMVLYSSCEWQYYQDAVPIAPAAIDTVTFSVHYVPSCTDITVARPNNNFTINSKDQHLVEGVKQTKVPILLSGYDLNNNIFEKLNFQFKSEANSEWIIPQESDFHVVASDEDQKEIPGDFTTLEWDLSGYPDGEYNIRAKTYCGTNADGTQIFDLSKVWSGMVDRQPPQVFGTPQPADGILSPDDDIVIEFNEEIYGEKLTKKANFDIRGILNGSDLRHDVSVQFDDNIENFVRIPDGINLAGKSFTIEFWLKTQRSHVNEYIFSQSSDPDNTIAIRLNDEGKFEFRVGDETYTVDEVSAADIIDDWHHWAFVYDNVREEVIVMKDGNPVSTGSIKPDYTGYGDIYVGKSIINNDKPLKGSLHELRIWESSRTASDITANMLITLSGKETGLIGYWPFDDASGELAAEKVHKRNATVNTAWNITPSGYAATFNSSSQGMMNMDFSDVTFTPEENFTIEFWFKGNDGANTCFLSNGHGDESDVTLYYMSPEGLANIANVLPLEDSVNQKLQPMVNDIYADEQNFLNEVKYHFGDSATEEYTEQILRFSKHLPTYWSINTDASGNIQVNNNGKRIKAEGENYFNNQWHHFALVVDRRGNTRIFIDGEMQASEPSTEWNGFGAARLFVGARGLFKQSTGGYEFDQYFDGKMDELRVWRSAIKQSQIERNNTMRLDGDEFGLAAYFPFESYKKVMGVPEVNGVTQDELDKEREVTSTTGMYTQQSDVPNIRMNRPSSKVDFSFVAKKDKVAFTINEPEGKIENCILDITAKNVEDMNGNKMQSPVTWSAYVDRNQVKWKDQQFDLEKQLYKPLTFTNKIINKSGEQQQFTISNLPGWLSVQPKSGTLDPLSEQTITFTVSEGTNTGSYSKDINLKTDFEFDEKLLVNLRVYEQLPDDWEVNPEEYENNMNIIGMVKINGVVSTDKNDKVAAFVDGECRGIANLKYVPEYDMYEVFLDVYSNAISEEYFELHIWDASSGREFKEVAAEQLVAAPSEYGTKYEFIQNTAHGSPSSPVQLSTNSTIIKKMPLTQGWNWKSFNITMDKSKPLKNLLNGVTFSRGDMIKGLTSYSEFSNYWVGTLNHPEPEDMYMFQVENKDTLKVSGIPIDPASTPITVEKGWNWIGFTPQVNISINDALGKFNPSQDDLIKSQHSFAMYDELMGWVGTLEFLRPNQGYKYKSTAPDSQLLYYPETGTMLKSEKAKAQEGPNPGISTWNNYSNNMSIVAKVTGIEEQNENDKIKAYSNNELRGKSSSIHLDNGENMYFMTIYGNQDKDTLSFTYTHKDKSYSFTERLEYKPSSVKGDIGDPYVFNVDKTTSNANITEKIRFEVHPNPFRDEFEVAVKQPENKSIDIKIVNVIGETVKSFSGLKNKNTPITINARKFNPGVYFAVITVGETKFHKRIIKK